MKRAINDGFKGTISAIIDANLTMITGIVLSCLYQPIRVLQYFDHRYHFIYLAYS